MRQVLPGLPDFSGSMMCRRFARLGLTMATAAVAAVVAPAVAVERELVPFQLNQTTTFGNSVFLLGDIPELGGNDVTRAVKLEPGAYPVWRVTIAIPRGTTYTYRYTLRSDAIANLSNPGNSTNLTTPQSASSSPGMPIPPTKSIFYHSGWAAPVLNWRQGAGAFAAVPMKRTGAGRGPAEWRWNAHGFGQAERNAEFYFTEGGGAGRDPAAGQYATMLDAAFVQDGQLFDYVPPPVVSPPSQTNVGTFFSTALNQNRPYRVLLPRGYVQNTSRRYPVLYMHDGQNVFDMGPFGTWNADETAAAMIRAGQMRELIIIGVDNDGSTRLSDYRPPDDGGRANVYAQFLINELKPVIDTNYRTLTDRANTATLGSSMGGLVSLYLGWDYNATYSRIGAMSGSWQFNQFPNRVRLGPKRDVRIYMDSGDSGASQDNAWPTLDLRDGLLRLGYALEGDLKHTIGYGQQHNEAAWAARLPGAYAFLFPATEGPNDLFAEPTRPIGDVDDDGDVDGVDIEYFVLALLGAPADSNHVARCDLDGNGQVNGEDIGTFLRLAWVNM